MENDKDVALLGTASRADSERPPSTPDVCPFCGKEPQPAIPGPMALCGDKPPFPILICQPCGGRVADFYGRARARTMLKRVVESGISVQERHERITAAEQYLASTEWCER